MIGDLWRIRRCTVLFIGAEIKRDLAIDEDEDKEKKEES